jgi:hypothetical protein
MNNQEAFYASTKESAKPEDLSLSEHSSTFYLLVSALAGFLIARLITNQEVIIALGTIVFAVLGMWLLAAFYRVRLIVRSLKRTNSYETRIGRNLSGVITDARRRTS